MKTARKRLPLLTVSVALRSFAESNSRNFTGQIYDQIGSIVYIYLAHLARFVCPSECFLCYKFRIIENNVNDCLLTNSRPMGTI